MQAPHVREAAAPRASTRGGPHFSLMSARPVDHELTVLIPAYNEQSRLRPTLDALGVFLDDTSIDYRVVVVDDGSSDDTARHTDGRGRRYSTLALGSNQGKGAAIRAGMKTATGSVVAFTDADLPYDLRALVDGFRRIRQGRCEIVFGARDMTTSVNHAPRRLSRRVATFMFSGVVSTLISRRVTDTQCGLKLFSRRAAHDIFSRTTIDGFAFDAEVVYLARRLGISFDRIPVTLINEYSSTLSLSRHALPMLADVMRIRHRHRQIKPAMRLPVSAESAEMPSRMVA